MKSIGHIAAEVVAKAAEAKARDAAVRARMDALHHTELFCAWFGRVLMIDDEIAGGGLTPGLEANLRASREEAHRNAEKHRLQMPALWQALLSKELPADAAAVKQAAE